MFANVVVGDEINRASPKTQSALLECMEEGHVTVDGTTYPLQTPFMVMATQNPIEMEGTYPLPEAQRDRFMARISVGYPSPSAELLMLDSHGGAFPLERLTPVTDGDTVAKLIETVRTIYASDAVKQYVVDLVTATRSTPALRLGASPRASLHLLRAVARPRRPRRPRPRPAGRRAGPGRAGPRPPHHPHRRDPAGPAVHRRRAARARPPGPGPLDVSRYGVRAASAVTPGRRPSR